MKNLLLLLLSFIVAPILGQVSTTIFEHKDAFRTIESLKRTDLNISKIMPPVDTNKLLEEDKELEGLDVPFNFGYLIDVNYTLSDGTWENVNNKKIWSMKVLSKGAYSINFTFSELKLSSDAELYIFNPEGTMVYGPVTKEQNIDDGIFITDLISGDEAIIQIIEPINTKEKSVL